jgi:hypothetical protein
LAGGGDEAETIGRVIDRRRAMIRAAFDQADRAMAHAMAGRFAKGALASMLTLASRPAFLDACAGIEKRYTEGCAAAHDPCLESGCSCEGEVCLQPLLRADAEYRKACGAEWVRLFADPANRDPFWAVEA